MPTTVQRSLMQDDGPPRREPMTRCPNCSHHFYADGGEVTDGDLAYKRDHEEQLAQSRQVDAYSGRGHRNTTEAGFGPRAQRRFEKGAESSADPSFAAHLARRRAARGGR